jgi:glycosyltransferase involved in cell wall biosynthesis
VAPEVPLRRELSPSSAAQYSDALDRRGGPALMPPTLLHVFPTLAIGGQQTRFATFANRLGPGYRHQLISLDGRDAAVGLLDPALDFTLLPKPAQPGTLLRDLRAVTGVSASIGHDVLLTYNWGSIEWAIVNRLHFHRPHIHLEDGFGPDEADRQKRRRILTRRLFLKRSMVVVPSRKLAGIAQNSWHLDPQRVHYIPNGIDPTRFDRIPISGEPFFHRRHGECVIGALSPLRQEKNLGRLLQAFGEMTEPGPPIRLVICGDGPERAALSELASRLNAADKVTFTGHVPRPETVMGAFDLFAMTSDTEQMPYAVLEAMSARLPIVSTAVGDIATMVAAENRPFIVPRDLPGHLASALNRLCGDKTLRRQIGQANRARVEQAFGIASMTDAFSRVLTDVSEYR